MYKVEMTKNAMKSYIKLPERIRKVVYEKLQIIALNPKCLPNSVKILRGELEGYRLRVQDWRVIFRIDHDILIVEVIKIGHRREVYR